MTFKINGQILILDLRMIPLIFCPFFLHGLMQLKTKDFVSSIKGIAQIKVDNRLLI